MPNQEPASAWIFGNGPVRVGTQGLFRPYLKTFVPPFLPTRLIAPGSPRMGYIRLWTWNTKNDSGGNWNCHFLRSKPDNVKYSYKFNTHGSLQEVTLGFASRVAVETIFLSPLTLKFYAMTIHWEQCISSYLNAFQCQICLDVLGKLLVRRDFPLTQNPFKDKIGGKVSFT